MTDQRRLRRLSQEAFDDIIVAMDWGGSEFAESFSVLDTHEGRVLMVLEDLYRAIEDGEPLDDVPDWQRDCIPDVEAVVNDDSGRFAHIPPTKTPEEYELMERFAATVEDERLADLLDLALGGRGSFGRFKRALERFPEERERWFRFRGDWVRQEAIDWLASVGFAPPEQPTS
jgi:hypothetical protein